MGYPWVAANEMLPVRDVPNCLMLNCGWFLSLDRLDNTCYYCSALMDMSLAGIWTSGTVQGHSSFSILINSNSFRVGPSPCDVLKVIQELSFHSASHYSQVTVVVADSARSVKRPNQFTRSRPPAWRCESSPLKLDALDAATALWNKCG